MKRWTSTQVTVEGHCDSRGSAEYNLGLGSRRATAVKDYLVSLGVPAGRVTVVSKGKERRPAARKPSPAGQQNRRGPLRDHGEVGQEGRDRQEGQEGKTQRFSVLPPAFPAPPARSLSIRASSVSVTRYFADLLSVHQQHRNLDAVARLEIRVGRDIDFLERDRERQVARHARRSPLSCRRRDDSRAANRA